MAEFQGQPKVRVIFKVGNNKELADDLNKGKIDFAFMDRHFEDLPFSYQILGKEHLKLWSKKSFKKQDFDSVAAQNFIMNQRGHPLLNQWFDENFNKIPSELNIKAASMDSSIRLFMTNEQMGAALLTSRVAAIAGLEEALERQTPIVRPVYLIKLKIEASVIMLALVIVAHTGRKGINMALLDHTRKNSPLLEKLDLDYQTCLKDEQLVKARGAYQSDLADLIKQEFNAGRTTIYHPVNDIKPSFLTWTRL